MDYGEKIAKAGLLIKAIVLSPEAPFTWASGFRMPIYNDNRMFLAYPGYRNLISEGFENILESEKIQYDVIAGTSTAGIPHATTLADRLWKPMIYVRDKPKDHGKRNQIEGADDLQGTNVVLIEDLISTGGSSAKAVKAIREAGGKCGYCLAIFSYGLDEAARTFEELNPRCDVFSLLTFDSLLGIAKENGYVNESQYKMLCGWKSDPFGWGKNTGFRK